jgi:16S rRNA (adenine(1408)-N(1))-methyltransferase
VVEVGTGDGLLVYRSARANPNIFFIGIDANAHPLEKISEKIHRKPSKGGLSNVLFVQAAVEDLPSELDSIAREVHVNFPWGSLLGAVAGGHGLALSNIRGLCSDGALLKVIVALDAEKDRAELDRLNVQPALMEFKDRTLVSYYENAGFEIVDRRTLATAEWSKLQSSWAKRLKGSGSRSIVSIVARAR